MVATWLIDVTGSTLMPAWILVAVGAFGLAIVTLTVRRNGAGATHLYR